MGNGEWGSTLLVSLSPIPHSPLPTPLVDCHFDLQAAGALGVCGGQLELVNAYCAETRARDGLARVGKGDLSRSTTLFPGNSQLASSRQPIVLDGAAERELLIQTRGEGGGRQGVGAGVDVSEWIDHLQGWRTIDADPSRGLCQVESAGGLLRADQFKFVERIERFGRRRGSLSAVTRRPLEIAVEIRRRHHAASESMPAFLKEYRLVSISGTRREHVVLCWRDGQVDLIQVEISERQCVRAV